MEFEWIKGQGRRRGRRRGRGGRREWDTFHGLRPQGCNDSLFHRNNEGKLCLILSIKFENAIFILDLNNGGGGDDGDGDGVDIRPNLRIPRSFGNVRFCVVDSTLYLLRFAETDYELYRFRLSPSPPLFDVVLDLGMLEKVPISLTPKQDVVLLRYGDSILFFSTWIRLYDSVDSNAERKQIFDFELYDPVNNVSTKFPQLWIRRRRSLHTSLELFHPLSSSRWEEFSVSDHVSHAFVIHSYAFLGTEFLIETDFGRMFSIDLVHPKAQWRLLELGFKFRACGHNFISSDGRLCIDDFGVTEFKVERGGDRDVFSGVSYPLSSFPSFRQSVTLMDSCTPCIVRVKFNDSDYDSDSCDERYCNPCWCVDVCKLDLLNLLKNEEEEQADFMERIVSLKFCIKNKLVKSTHVVDLFPC